MSYYYPVSLSFATNLVKISEVPKAGTGTMPPSFVPKISQPGRIPLGKGGIDRQFSAMPHTQLFVVDKQVNYYVPKLREGRNLPTTRVLST